MLETQAVTVPRNVAAAPRRSEQSLYLSAAAAPSPYRTIDSPSVRPSQRRKSVDRLARSEARLMMAAGACTTIFCAILVIYLAAYARVTHLGLAQSHARVQLRTLSQENEILRAQLAQVESPGRIVAQATALGMTPGAKQVCYINQTAGVASSGANSVNIASASIGH